MRASSTHRGCCTATTAARSRARPPMPCWAGSASPHPSAVLVSATTTHRACPARSCGAEALFRTLKYSPGFPRQGFATLAAVRDWVHAFADWHNTVHRHRSIQYVTPQQRYSGEPALRAVAGRPSCTGTMRCMSRHDANIRPAGPRACRGVVR